MAELADAQVLGACAERRRGSSPLSCNHLSDLDSQLENMRCLVLGERETYNLVYVPMDAEQWEAADGHLRRAADGCLYSSHDDEAGNGAQFQSPAGAYGEADALSK